MTTGSADSGLINNAFQVEVSCPLTSYKLNITSRLNWRTSRLTPTRLCTLSRSLSPFPCALDPCPTPDQFADSSHPDLLKGIYACSFKKPSKIQEKALPMLLNNPLVLFATFEEPL